jgi:FkbH-like protein
MDTSFDGWAPETLLRKRKGLLRELLAQEPAERVRMAVLGSSTTQEFVDLLELLLLQAGLRPEFLQGEYGRFYEESVLEPERLAAFRPDVVVLCTGTAAIQGFPGIGAGEAEFQQGLQQSLERFRQVWDALEAHTGAMVLQTTFEPWPLAALGGLEASSPAGRQRFCRSLNEALAGAARARTRLRLLDQAAICERLGRDRFLDLRRWYRYKILTTPEASLELARAAAAVLRAVHGRTRKCLVLDLDNTLWGGVIGDDGADRIRIGRETPEAEAYTAFQEYCLELRQRGVLLAVCSKNEEVIARQGLAHPDSVLRLEHFSAFKANWLPKPENLAAIAGELNIGLDSLVFVDDNPAERALVRAQLPAVAVPEMGGEIEAYPWILDGQRYFEPLALSAEDLARAGQYQANARRSETAAQFKTYGEYLRSLEMSAEIASWKPVYLDRITQLCNKTNQFNLTTRRYTPAEIEAIHRDPGCITLYGKLRDRFGENGLISVICGRRHGPRLVIETWLMSCRVLKRDMELAMLDELVAQCRSAGVRELVGTYKPTEKNAMVADHYRDLGFRPMEQAGDGASTWLLDLAAGYENKNRHIPEITHG